MLTSDGMAPKSSAALDPQTITLSPDVIAQTTRILHWFSQRDEQGHLSNLISYQSGERNAAAKRLLLDTVKLFDYEPSQTVEEIKQRVDDMVELYLHWRATAESVGWGTDPIGHDSKIDEAKESLTIRETILSFCYYYYEMDTIMHGDPKIERSATSEKRPNPVMEKHPSIGVTNPASFRPRRLRSSTRAVTGQKVIIPRFSSEEPSDSKEDELARGKRPAGMSIRKYWGLPSSSSGPELQAPASQTSPDETLHSQQGVQEVSAEEFHDLLLSASPAILSTTRKCPGEASKNNQSGQDKRPGTPEDIGLEPLDESLDKSQNKPQNKRQDKRHDRSQDEPRNKAQEEEAQRPRLSPHQEIPQDSKPASPANEPLLLGSSATAKTQTPKLEPRPTVSKRKSSASASPSNEPLLLGPNTAKTQRHRIELRPIVPKLNSPAPTSRTRKSLSTDAPDHRAHLAFAHAVRANPNRTLHIPSFYAPINPPGISLNLYPRTTSFGPAQAFGDAHVSPQLASHQNDTTHTLPNLQIPEFHAHENISGGLLAFPDSARDRLDQRDLVPPPVKYRLVESRPPVTYEDDRMAAPAQAGNLSMLRQSPMIFPSSRSIFQPPRGPPFLIAHEPSSSRVVPKPAPMKRGRERAHSAANSNSDTPPLQKKKSRIGSPSKLALDERLVGVRGPRRGKVAETQQRIEGIYTTLEERQDEEGQQSRYETRKLMETGKRLAEESNQAAEGLRKANAKLQEHLVVVLTKAHEKIDAQAELYRTAIRQREQQGSPQTTSSLTNNIGGIYHQEELIRRQDEMLGRMEEAIRRQDEKIEKMVQKWEKKK